MNGSIRWTVRYFSFALFVAFLASTAAARAQSAVDGAAAGTVVDSTGAALPGAIVVLHNSSTGADVKSISDYGGYFRVTRLVPGVYRVTASHDGFANYTAENVAIEVGKLTDIAPSLGAAGTTSTVEVSGENPVMNAESSEFSTQFDPVALSTLPINGRHWTSFAL
ncbi:MAG: carboxypeptidase-like regulatory domain-containing protein [Acidobacteriota bacterium]|nr:carboxypeptidase-like regulatory domain-containing protein [Acidobacteriota bacterium]